MTPRSLLRTAADVLSAVTDCPQFEAEILLAHVLQKERSYFIAYPEVSLEAKNVKVFQDLIAERLTGKPIAYLLQQREFWSLPFFVSSATLIPRPETETLVAMVLAQYPEVTSALRVLDLGTGSAAIALALASERKNWQIVATDVSQDALDIAKKNAQRLAFPRVSFYCGSWFTALPVDTAHDKFDVIVSNPPYIGEDEWPAYQAGLQFEPKTALVSGANGMDAISHIVNTSAAYLAPQGALFIEHGFRQGALVRQLFEAAGFLEVKTAVDLNGCERVTMGRRSLSDSNRYL